MRFLSIFFVLISINTGLAASLSDLNTQGFQEKAAPPVSVEKNPFVSHKAAPQDLLVEDLQLAGIIYNADESYALISGYILREGDGIGGYKVKVIESDHVVLRQLDQVRVLKLE